jgi:ankyrin repeat protein
MIWLIVIAYGFITAFACAYLAKEKGKNQDTWFIIGFLLGIIGILIIGFSKPEIKPVSNVASFYKPRFIDIDCPIDVRQTQFSINDNGLTSFSAGFLNLSKKEIKSVKFIIKCYDSFWSPIGAPQNNEVLAMLQDQSAVPGSIFGINNEMLLQNHPSTRNVDIIVLKVLYKDGSIWEKGSKELIKVEIDEITDKNDLQNLNYALGTDAICYANRNNEYWTCVCGRLNYIKDLECIRCKRDRDYLLTNYNNKENAKKMVNLARANIKKQTTFVVSLCSIIILLPLLVIAFSDATDQTFSYKVYALKKAVSQGDSNKVKRLIREGTDLSAIDDYDILDNVANSDNKELIKILLENGIDGNTSLQEAIHNDNAKLIMALTQNGIIVDNSNIDPGLLATEVCLGHLELAKALIIGGIDINSQDEHGYTALYWAACNGNTEIVKLLLDRHADLYIRNDYGSTPLDTARYNGHTQIINMLENAMKY